jgi:hypothetical protein
MPSASSKKEDKRKADVKRILDKLDELDDESLGRIWIRARDTLFQRNKKKSKAFHRARRMGETLPGSTESIVTVLRLDLVALTRIKEWWKSPRRPGILELDTIGCSGQCHRCVFGVQDLDKGWKCVPAEHGIEVVHLNDPNRLISVRKRKKKTSKERVD